MKPNIGTELLSGVNKGKCLKQALLTSSAYWRRRLFPLMKVFPGLPEFWSLLSSDSSCKGLPPSLPPRQARKLFLGWDYCRGDAEANGAAQGSAEDPSWQSRLEAGHLFHHPSGGKLAVPLKSKAGSREKQRDTHGPLRFEILLAVTGLLMTTAKQK